MLLPALALVTVTTASQSPIADSPGPIEQAVIEHRCTSVRMGTTASADPYHDCLVAQLAVLRSDFGPDLKGLSPTERQSLDRACSRLRAFEGRERYIGCLSNRLAALRNERGVASLPASASAPAAAPPGSPVDSIPRATPVPTASRVDAPASKGVWIVVAAGVLGSLAGSVFLRSRRRAVRPAVCRTCGGATQAGDLCPRCRHEAAEALRRAAAARGASSA
jgi:hypothetical protein